jgi:hypothetical protein
VWPSSPFRDLASVVFRGPRRGPRAAPRAARAVGAPRLEQLEGRALPGTALWANPGGGDWDNPSNWWITDDAGLHHGLPGVSDSVMILKTLPDPSPWEVTVSSGPHVVHSLSGGPGVRLVLAGGALSLDDASALDGDLALAGGDLTGAGTVTVHGDFLWSGGTMSGTGHTVLTGSSTLGGGSASVLDGRTIDNLGTATVNAYDGIAFKGDAVWDNHPGSTFVMQDGSFLGNAGPGAGAQFSNSGLFHVGTSADTEKPEPQPWIDLQVINLDVFWLTLPGPARLTINGDFIQGTSGTLRTDLGDGWGGEWHHDPSYGNLGHWPMTINGTATLGGTLQVTLPDNFAPASGSSFLLMGLGARAGEFASLSLPGGISAGYDTNGVTLTAL